MLTTLHPLSWRSQRAVETSLGHAAHTAGQRHLGQKGNLCVTSSLKRHLTPTLLNGGGGGLGTRPTSTDALVWRAASCKQQSRCLRSGRSIGTTRTSTDRPRQRVEHTMCQVKSHQMWQARQACRNASAPGLHDAGGAPARFFFSPPLGWSEKVLEVRLMTSAARGRLGARTWTCLFEKPRAHVRSVGSGKNTSHQNIQKQFYT